MKTFEKILLIIIIGLGVFLRLNNYTQFPQKGATSDEYTYSFVGVSLLTSVKPVSWSHFDYPNKKIIKIDNIVFPIVEPYFDHPPLFGLLVGGWALLFGQHTFEQISLSVIRIVPIILSIFTSVLLFLIGKKLFSLKTAIWALLIFSTTTIFIMNMRVVISENLLTPLLLGGLYIYITTGKKISTKRLLMLGVIAGLSLLTKISGISVFFILLFFLISDKVKYKQIGVYTLTFLLFGVLLLMYAWTYDFNLFLEIQKLQGSRNIGPQSLWLVLFNSAIVHKVVHDGWYYFGLFSIFSLFSNYEKYKYIIIPSFIYFFFLLLTLTQEGSTGWYMIPLFPFMSLAIAEVVKKSIEEKNWIMILFVVFIGFTIIERLWEATFGLSNSTYRGLVLIMILPFFLLKLFHREKFYERLGNAFFYFFILANIIMTFTYSSLS